MGVPVPVEVSKLVTLVRLVGVSIAQTTRELGLAKLGVTRVQLCLHFTAPLTVWLSGGRLFKMAIRVSHFSLFF